MSSKSRLVVLAALGLVAFGVGTAMAAGGGAKGSRVGGGVAKGPRTGCANPGQPGRTENRIFGSTWAYRNAYWGGYGLGYGYGYPGWGFSPYDVGYGLVDVPYFALFPPVYYGNGENSESPQPAPAAAAFVTPPRPPLRIVNPYYVEEKADKP